MPTVRPELLFATHLAPNIRPVYEFVVERVGIELGVAARLVTGASYQPIREGAVDFVFLCGLPYVKLRREDPTSVEAIAAPVVAGERYRDRPIYFSDVIVRMDDAAGSLADLRGRSWAYNELDSHSGYLLTLFTLLRMGEAGPFFGSTLMTGFHEESVRLVATGAIDASAIDSHVLGVEFRRNPGLADRVRVIGRLGPSTVQPLVATRSVSPGLRQQVTDVVTSLAGLDSGRAQLAAGLVDHFVPIADASYDDIREMLRVVEGSGIGL